jgi:hypothetical protein
MESRLSKGLQMLRDQGHKVEGVMLTQVGTLCWRIDDRPVATSEEIICFGEGVYSLSELEELWTKRRAEEDGGEPGS